MTTPYLTSAQQAHDDARPVAGDLDLGREFLEKLGPWIYRRYLGLADITGIKALKRRIEQRTQREGADSLNVKTGHGGIRDIEFVIQHEEVTGRGEPTRHVAVYLVRDDRIARERLIG